MSRHLVIRALVVCLTVLAAVFGGAVFSPEVAWAQAKKSVAVGVIEGPQGGPTRKRVLATLKKSGGYEITDAEDLRPGGDKGGYAAMAQALQVEAIIVGRVSRGLDLTLNVIGPDGSVIEDVKLKGGSAKGLEKAIDNELEIAIAGPLGGAKKAAAKPADKPPPKGEEEAEPEDEEEAVPEDEEEDKKGSDDDDDEEDEEKKKDDDDEEVPTASEAKQPGLRPLELLVGARLYSRDFAYQELKTPTVFPYKLAMAPAIIAATRIYPFAFFRDDALGNLGIMARLEVGIATSTNYAQQIPGMPGQPPTELIHKLNTGTSEWQAGLRGRLPLGRHELGMFGLYGAHSFILVGDEGPTPDRPNRPYPLVPDVNYVFLRFGFDARVRVAKLTAAGHFAPRFLTSMAQIDQKGFWFPGATGSGVDFGVSLGYEIVKFLDIAAGVDFLRYGFDFNAIPDDAGIPGSGAPLIAGGATDTYLSGWLGVILHFDGPSSADGSVEVEAKSEPDAEPAGAEPEDSEEE